MNHRRAPVLLAALSLLLLAACGSQATLKRYAYAAQVLEDVSATAKVVVLDLDRAALEAAVVGVTDPADRAAKVHAAQATFDSRHLVDAVNLLIEAKNTYINGVLLAAQQDSPSWADLKPAIKAALDAYAALKQALGVDGTRLPAIPAAVTAIIGA